MLQRDTQAPGVFAEEDAVELAARLAQAEVDVAVGRWGREARDLAVDPHVGQQRIVLQQAARVAHDFADLEDAQGRLLLDRWRGPPGQRVSLALARRRVLGRGRMLGSQVCLGRWGRRRRRPEPRLALAPTAAASSLA